MTVNELIEELRKYDGDMQTVVRGGREYSYLRTQVYERRVFSLGEPEYYSDTTFLEGDKKTHVVFLG